MADVELVFPELFPPPPVDEVVPVLEGVIGSVASSYVGSLSASNCSSQTSIRLILKLINSPLKQAQYGFQ